jgi:twitching motility two-component system response regulator PilH
MKKVFIAEDNKIFINAVTRLLAFHGFHFKVAEERNDILEQVRSYAPDIMILDVKMPFADGLEICRLAKEDPKLKSAYVIILSGLDKETDIAAGKEAGADCYMLKPFSPTELIGVVKAACKQ